MHKSPCRHKMCLPRSRAARAEVSSYDQPGIPAEEYFAGMDLPEQLKTATVYETPDGPVLTLPTMPKKRRAVKPKSANLS
jgi:hypothetical protein